MTWHRPACTMGNLAVDIDSDDDDDDDDDGCMCEFPPDCQGLGVLPCRGCGGDLCVCVCGGMIDCEGCDYCRDRDDDDDYDESVDRDVT